MTEETCQCNSVNICKTNACIDCGKPVSREAIRTVYQNMIDAMHRNKDRGDMADYLFYNRQAKALARHL